jgi:hypothetical protein
MSTISQVATNEPISPAATSGMGFLVGFYFSFRAAIVLASVRLLGTEPSTGAAISFGVNVLLLAAVCFHSFQPRRDAWQWMRRMASIRWVFVFLIFSGLSLTWSATVSPSTSFAYWCGMATDVGLAMLLLRDEPIVGKAHSMMKGYIWSACALALLAWIMPAQSDLRLGDPDFFNTNQIANLCAFAILFCQYLARSGNGKWHLTILFLSITLLRTLSKTTLVAFLGCEILLMVQDRSMSRKTKACIAGATVLVLIVFWGLFQAYYTVYTNAGNQAETLTGRTGIWAYALTAALEKPWLGNGFDSMWKVVPPFGPDRFEARHAENELLQQFYAYGAAGVVILIGLYGSLYWKIRRLPRGPLRLILAGMVLFVAIRGLAEAEPFDLLLPLWMIVLVSVLADRSNNWLTASL